MAQDLTIVLESLQNIGPLNWMDNNWFLRGIVIDPAATPLGTLSNELNFMTVDQYPRIDPMPASDIAAGNSIRWYRKAGSSINVGDVAGVEFFDFLCSTGSEVCSQTGTINLALGNNLPWAPETGGVLGGPLPVELVGFDALVTDGDILLSWQTASETNNAGFFVEWGRPSAQGSGIEVASTIEAQRVHWQTLAFVDGHGTTQEAQRYRYSVRDLAPGQHLFRLRQVDFDGTFEYSAVVEATLEVPGTHYFAPAYPNPFHVAARLEFAVKRAQQVELGLYNVQGQLITVLFRGLAPAEVVQAVEVTGAGLPSGVYVARLVGETFTESRHLVLSK